MKQVFLLFLLATRSLLATEGDARHEAMRQQASILTRRGSEQLLQGDHGGAATSLEAAIALYAKVAARNDEGLAWARLAQAYAAMGAYDAAADALQEARELGQTTGDPAAQAVADAVHAMQRASDWGPSTSFLWSFDPQLDLLAGGRLMFDQFWPLLNDLLVIAMDPQFIASSSGQRIDSSLPMMTSMLALLEGRELFEKGKITEARERWMGALHGVVANDVRSGLFACIGATYLKEGNAAEAIRWFASAADATESALPAIDAPELLTSYLGSERRWYHDITIETLLRNDRTDEAFDYSERARARAFLQLVGNRRIGTHGGSEPLVREAERLRARIARLQRRGTAARDELRAARKAWENILLRLRVTAPEYASLSTVEPVRIDELRKALPRDTTLISYFVSTYGVRAWVIDADRTTAVALPIDRAALDRVLCWAESLRSGGRTRGMQAGGGECAEGGTAEESYELLFCPVRQLVRNERIIFVPHGELHQVPFAALRDRDSGRHLVESYTVTLAPSASAVRFLRTRETPVGRRALILGNPRTPLGPLPGSEREAAAVARRFRTRARIGAAATEDSLHSLRGSVDLLHLAAHGVYDPDHPLFSYVALSPGATSDGRLEVHEILAGLDLTGVNLVVLSACRSAAGKRGGGDDVVGLTRAMLYAGSAAVVSTLWDIDDAASARLMETFYDRLLAGDTAADALRAAQRAMLQSEAYADPRFWAAFTISGDPRGRWNDASGRRPSAAPSRPRQ